MNLTAHLNELNACLQGENQHICAMLQIITAVEMEPKLWQAQVMASILIHCWLNTVL